MPFSTYCSNEVTCKSWNISVQDQTVLRLLLFCSSSESLLSNFSLLCCIFMLSYCFHSYRRLCQDLWVTTAWAIGIHVHKPFWDALLCSLTLTTLMWMSFHLSPLEDLRQDALRCLSYILSFLLSWWTNLTFVLIYFLTLSWQKENLAWKSKTFCFYQFEVFFKSPNPKLFSQMLSTSSLWFKIKFCIYLKSRIV